MGKLRTWVGVMALGLVASSAQANMKRAADIVTLLSDAKVKKLLKTGALMSVEYEATSKCFGGPSLYTVVMKQDEETCHIYVSVGACKKRGAPPSDRTRVSIKDETTCE